MMKARLILFLFATATVFAACQKNTASKIPQIGLLRSGPDSIRVNLDTCYIQFNLEDGDADIGNSGVSLVYFKDSRFDSAGFLTSEFPPIDGSIEDPKKGIKGVCTFYPLPQPVPRSDSNHFKYGDTLYYELYITDRAGHASNHITSRPIIVRP